VPNTAEAHFVLPPPFDQVAPSNGAGYWANGSGCTAPIEAQLPDGVWFGYVLLPGHEASGNGVASFDLACFYEGEAAQAEADHDGEFLFGNWFYVRNRNSHLYSLTIPRQSDTYWLDSEGDYHHETYRYWPVGESVYGFCQEGCAVWIWVEGGQVTELWEQEPEYSD
jgi:hypothetical protein